MYDIIEVKQNWDSNTLFIDVSLGNICNYQCDYCFPGANEGNIKWPEYDLFVKNISHLIEYYKKNGKTKFDIHFTGGEPTHWKKLPEFIKFLKSNFKCLISMTTNGSKKIDYWKTIAPYFDRIHMSCHHQFVNIENFRNIVDYLYEQNIIVSVSAMMHPMHWNKCMNLVEYLKSSKHKWTIRYCEILGTEYTEDQKKILSKHRARGPNIFWFIRNNKYSKSRVKIIDSKFKSYRVADNKILLNKMNNFLGWECSLGVEWLHISTNGNISGTCGQVLFGEDKNFNIRDSDFTSKFNPIISTTICKQKSCNCMYETNMPKRKLPCIK